MSKFGRLPVAALFRGRSDYDVTLVSLTRFPHRSRRNELEPLKKLGQIRLNPGCPLHVTEPDPFLKLRRRHVLVIVSPEGGKRGQ